MIENSTALIGKSVCGLDVIILVIPQTRIQSNRFTINKLIDKPLGKPLGMDTLC